MFAIRCPASMLWHPSVHHSLLLLRALEQPHTLLLDPHTTSRGRLFVPLLSECAREVRIQTPPVHHEFDSAAGASTERSVLLYRAEDLLHVVNRPLGAGRDLGAACPTQSGVFASLLEYLEASTVSSHVISAIDALLVSLNTGDMETMRQTHACLVELIERLEASITDESLSEAYQTDQKEPLSAWPLFCTLQFLIEEGGMLTSAFPRTNKAYTRLCHSSKAVAQHRRLVQRTVEQLLDVGSSTDTDVSQGARVEMNYPAKGFLRDVQRHLASYNRSMEERTTDGVSGEKGPLNSRASGGRLGIQAVQARLPWTLQARPLRKG
ncbi:hypothetical protein - conserved [Leishmania donovani]|uniref:Uncharacterized protein n=4 Tax=Leishmania donovani species complex TaxID=38574 RepID=A4I6T4_LEIIN|nr:conserved hypothetical protein [Leishmania infantum JPCM5]XP_003863250.1 hypothetical protein, conserved [Leishmania donovani]CAC9519426.1 hypothetical_protein_-_conserved [Leishmania infantum]CAJ1991351.1 hypothetical protein - conserved [Leishmania donovani]CAM70511.1 conserved hypothetical protein [Leishmania infantum JPCM5]CBZ36561.1 hypothetical protein, conserved [Leishmania donovani]SUZ44377.1 hypothetical_protein_-_conserved [Leishmania infantum]|eukprot:XP_001467453.1 conserved hypothetical protein [Leishmania infantum JPCM5]